MSLRSTKLIELTFIIEFAFVNLPLQTEQTLATIGADLLFASAEPLASDA